MAFKSGDDTELRNILTERHMVQCLETEKRKSGKSGKWRM